MTQKESTASGLSPISKREQTRLDLFELIQQKLMTRRDAAVELQLSERHTCRLYKAWLHKQADA